MAKKRHHLIPLFSTRATATISVALVLFILGISAFVGVVTHRVTSSIKENMGFVVIFNDDVTASDIASLRERIMSSQAVASCEYSSPEVVLDRWQKMVGEEEDIMRLAGVNPFQGELDVHVKASHASADSINEIVAPLMLMPQVNEIKVHTELIDQINATLKNVALGLSLVAVALLIVSFVLIFNTVRLSVYSRRFTIYTMKLVGATAGFIRRPFLVDNIVNGLVAGLIAVVALSLLVYYCRALDLTVASVLDVTVVAPILVAVVIVGMLICFIAALFATNRYLRLTYDEMFK